MHRVSTDLPDTVVETEPEEQQGAEEGGLEQRVKHAGQPAMDQECEGENGI